MGARKATMQVRAPFSTALGYEQVNVNYGGNVTLITRGVVS